MTVDATQLVGKLNFVISSRRLKEKEYIEDYPELPRTSSQEEEVVRELMFQFLKKLFPGCKIRPNANSFSLRLDGQIHRKANKLREIYNNDHEWRSWFDNNASRVSRAIRENRQAFQSSGMVEKREVDGKTFLYVPCTPTRIYGYVNYGLVEFCQWLENEYQRDVRVSGVYDEAMRLMEAEIERKERERRERIERELREYKQQIFRELFKPVSNLQESEDAIDRLFAHKFREWARENGKAPEYALEANAKAMVTRGLKVKIMAPPGSEEEGWIALPPFEGYPDPEGYEMQGWGKVTSIDMTSERSRRGEAPIVVQDYLYTEFHLEYWQHLLPEGYAEIVEVSKQLHREAEAEIEPWLEQERIQKEREEEERRAREEERRRIQEEERRLVEEQIRQQVEEERRRREAEERRAAALAEQLRQQQQAQAIRESEEAERMRQATDELAEALGLNDGEEVTVEEVHEERRETPDIDVDLPPANPDLLQNLLSQMSAAPERASEEGLYRNSRAIPLERYVGITAGGNTRRFASARSAAQWLGYNGQITVRDFHAPHEPVEVVVVNNEDENLPF
jgi:hypothetical protein